MYCDVMPTHQCLPGNKNCYISSQAGFHGNEMNMSESPFERVRHLERIHTYDVTASLLHQSGSSPFTGRDVNPISQAWWSKLRDSNSTDIHVNRLNCGRNRIVSQTELRMIIPCSSSANGGGRGHSG
ncbi:hypothetical protein CEXT_66671 [Caerostris extrusa]|uniref:Uncharacterized protein n=1 Tax=Caerostris extrusa TaxID=172846 RepID=A0AAV4MK77_CAEEX|nr:hypothetical protein CEXT_66671 [Caerostris extrusa]